MEQLEAWMKHLGERATELADYSVVWFGRLDEPRRRLWFGERAGHQWSISRPTASRWIRGRNVPRQPADYRMIADFLYERSRAHVERGGQWPLNLPTEVARIERALRGGDDTPDPPHVRAHGLGSRLRACRRIIEAQPGSGALSIVRAELEGAVTVVRCRPGDTRVPLSTCGRILLAAHRAGRLPSVIGRLADRVERSVIARLPFLGAELALATDHLAPRIEALAAMCVDLITDYLEQPATVIVLDDAHCVAPECRAVLSQVMEGLDGHSTRLYEIHGAPVTGGEHALIETITPPPLDRLASCILPHVEERVKGLPRLMSASCRLDERGRGGLGRLEVLLRLVINGHRPPPASQWPESLREALTDNALVALHVIRVLGAPVLQGFIADVLAELDARDGLALCETAWLLEPVRPGGHPDQTRSDDYLQLADRCLFDALPPHTPEAILRPIAARLAAAIGERQPVLLDQDPGAHWALLGQLYGQLGQHRAAIEAYRRAHHADRASPTGAGRGAYAEECERILDTVRHDDTFNPLFALDLLRDRWYRLIIDGSYARAEEVIALCESWVRQYGDQTWASRRARIEAVLVAKACEATWLCGRAHIQCRSGRPGEALTSIRDALALLVGCALIGEQRSWAVSWLEALLDTRTPSEGAPPSSEALASDFLRQLHPLAETITTIEDREVRDRLQGRIERLIVTLLKEAGLALAKLGLLTRAEAVLCMAEAALAVTNRDRSLDPARRIWASIAVHRGFVAWRMGRHSLAFRLLYRAVEDAAMTGDWRLGLWAKVGRVHLLVQRGDEARAEARLLADELMQMSGRASDHLLDAYCHYLCGAVRQHEAWYRLIAGGHGAAAVLTEGVKTLDDAVRDDLTEAMARYDDAIRRVPVRCFETLYAHMRRCEVLLLYPALLSGESAISAIDAFVVQCEAIEARREHAIGLRLRAVVLARGADHEGAAAMFTAADALLDLVGDTVERARNSIWRAVMLDAPLDPVAVRVVMCNDQAFESHIVIEALPTTWRAPPRAAK